MAVYGTVVFLAAKVLKINILQFKQIKNVKQKLI